MGSERVPRKNLRLLGGQPLVCHVSRTALRAPSLDRVFVNTESSEIATVAESTGVEIYMRRPHLAASSVTTDEILYDFAKAIPSRAIAVINPTAPFVTAKTINQVMAVFHAGDADATLFTTTQMRKHLVVDGMPANFKPSWRSPRTQDLPPFAYINFVMFVIARVKVIGQYERRGYCLWSPPLAFFPISGREAHDIDDENDFAVAEAMLAREGPTLEVENRPQRTQMRLHARA
jgi:N-acylneuraminate cytidylyltransferase